MKLRKLQSPFWSLILVASLVSLPYLGSEAQARGGGGYHGGGGFSGGSFRGGGGYASGPRGGAVAVGPRGGAVAEGPRGCTAARGPYGGEAARGPGGGTAYRPGGPAAGNWNHYYGPGYGGVAAGVAAGVAVGTVVGALSAGARPLAVGGQTYYYDNNTYYQPCYQGTDLSYCVVADPNQ